MKVLVTGAGGQLGKALAEAAAYGDFDWLFTDLAELDITDRRAVELFFTRESPDITLNCAAFTDVDRAETERMDAFRTNSDAPHILAKISAASGAALVHISTDFVFDGTSDRPYTEKDLPAPLNVYGESKLAGELAVLSSGVRGAVIRTSWLYSPWGRNFVKSILRTATAAVNSEEPEKNSAEIGVVADQRGCPTSAASLAGAIVKMIPVVARSTRPAEIYNFCDAGIVSRADFAREIVRQAGIECRVMPVTSAEYPSVARRPLCSALDVSKITRTFGIVSRPWQETLAECINTIQNGR